MADDSLPDWSNSKNWDEFDWEKAMRQRDNFAANYLDLLNQFGDLPGSDEIILKKMGQPPVQPLEEDDYYVDFDPEDIEELEEEDDDEEGFDGVFYYESTPVYKLLRQVSIGWCNIYATFLLPEHRKFGVNILFHLGRAMAHLAGSVGDGQYDEINSKIASGKRAADQVNKAIGLVEQLNQVRPSYKKVTDAINKHLREVHDKIVDHLMLLRTKK